jgi:hypothetical protein
MESMNFADEIENAAGGPIEAIVIGPFGWGVEMTDDLAYGEESIQRSAPVKRGVVMSWDMARPSLDYDYDDGYGSPSCDAIYAYTADRIVFVSTYDGSTCVRSIPRNPQPCEPEMPGGG